MCGDFTGVYNRVNTFGSDKILWKKIILVNMRRGKGKTIDFGANLPLLVA